MSSLFSSDSSSVTKAPNVGVQTGEAPGTSFNVDGYKSDQDITVNQVLTDHGAIDGVISGLTDISEEAIYTGGGLGRDAIESGEKNVDRVLDFASDFAAGAGKLVRESVIELGIQVENALASADRARADSFDFGRRSLDSVDDAVYTVERISGKALDNATDLSLRVSDLTEDLNEQNTKFATDVLYEFTGELSDLNEERSQESSQVLGKISELATVVQTGGESLNTAVNKTLGIGALFIVGFVASVAIWKAGKAA